MSGKGKDSLVDAANEKFKWDTQNTRIFIDVLTVWKKKNIGVVKWEKVAEEFKNASGITCSAVKLKSKHDNMKQNWQLFTRLRNSETGLGFNSSTGMIEASDDWWAARIQENNNFKKFKTNGLPLCDEMDKLWGGNSATGDEVISQAQGDDDCFNSSPHVAQHVEVDDLVDNLSTGSSPTRLPSRMQEAASVGEDVVSKHGSAGTSTGRKRKKISTTESTPQEIQDVCQELKSVSSEQRSYYVTKANASEEQRAYFASKKTYYDKMSAQLDNYNQCVQALLELHINETYPHLYYYTIELFASPVQRSLFLAIPHDSRFGYIESVYNKNNGFGSSG